MLMRDDLIGRVNAKFLGEIVMPDMNAVWERVTTLMGAHTRSCPKVCLDPAHTGDDAKVIDVQATTETTALVKVDRDG